MDKFIELYRQIVNDPAKHEEMEHALDFVVKKVKSVCKDDYERALHKMYYIAHDGHFCEKLAKEAVANMRNANGTTGEKWSMEQTNQVMQQYGVQANPYDFYYVMNMFYSDFSTVMGEDVSNYCRMANAYINDVDAKPDKTLKIYLSTHCMD